MDNTIGGISLDEIMSAATDDLEGRTPPAPAPAPDTLAEPKYVDICSNCGCEMTDRFCTNCGWDKTKQNAVSADIEKCMQCGAIMENDAMFCVECGWKKGTVAPAINNEPPVVSADVCPNCGAAYEEDALFCVECGCKKGADIPQQQPTVHFDEPANDMVNVGGYVCSNCGAPIDLDAAFCTECGCRIVTDDVPAYADNICPICGEVVTNKFCTNCGWTKG